MKVVFRADSADFLGHGHISRCLTLAALLRTKGCKVTFICRDLPGNIAFLVREKGFGVHLLPANQGTPETEIEPADAAETAAILKATSPDWLIVDNYKLGYDWEKQQRPFAKKIMVIDDYFNRKHECDLYLNQNLPESYKEEAVKANLPAACQILIGPQFALLREEFLEARSHLHRQNGQSRNLFVFFGGSDPTNETAKALSAIKNIRHRLGSIEVVVGASNRNKEEIYDKCLEIEAIHYVQINSIAHLMSRADLAIGAGGATTWERCCLGLPTITIAVADNQEGIARLCAARGAAIYLGSSKTVTELDIQHAIIGLIDAPGAMAHISATALNLVDGQGARRVLSKMAAN